MPKVPVDPERSPAAPAWPLTPPSRRPGRWAAALGVVVLVGLAAQAGRDGPVAPDPMPAAEGAATHGHAPVGDRVAVRVHPRSAEERAAVRAAALDVWTEHDDPGAPLDVVVDAAGLRGLAEAAIPLAVLDADLDATAAAERARLEEASIARPPAPDQWFREYRDLAAIHAHLDELAALRPDLAAVETIGASLEGRPLQALRIRGAGPRRHGVLVDAGLHAREWIAVMVGTCVADRLVRRYDDDPRVRALVDAAEIVVVPVANPDGYVHSWQRDRYWRKNRRGGHGVDLNRNFGVAWGGAGSSGSPASQVYRGAAPLSEPESQALAELVDSGRFAAHVDFHSYGQLLLHPWSYTRERSRDHARLSSLAATMAEAIRAAHGERYRPMSGESLYPASGTLMDWAYGTHGIASFVIELRPRGGTGFVLPPDQIEPTCDEGLAAVLALGEGLPVQ